jgi:hypothetical protein
LWDRIYGDHVGGIPIDGDPVESSVARTLHRVAGKTQATSPTDTNVEEFLQSVPDHRRRMDAIELIRLMTEITGEPARMWGSSIIGFGSYHYKYDSGHEGDSAIASFSPRRQHLVVYLVGGFEDRHTRLLDRLGKFKTGKGCLPLHQAPRRHRCGRASPADPQVRPSARRHRQAKPNRRLIRRWPAGRTAGVWRSGA